SLPPPLDLYPSMDQIHNSTPNAIRSQNSVSVIIHNPGPNQDFDTQARFDEPAFADQSQSVMQPQHQQSHLPIEGIRRRTKSTPAPRPHAILDIDMDMDLPPPPPRGSFMRELGTAESSPATGYTPLRVINGPEPETDTGTIGGD
ncbi:11548_t:CDS:2, partial [Acaulospora colombiana]